MWDENEALPQRERKGGKRSGSLVESTNNIQAKYFDTEDADENATDPNPELRSSAEPGCSYECEPLPSERHKAMLYYSQLQSMQQLIIVTIFCRLGPHCRHPDSRL